MKQNNVFIDWNSLITVWASPKGSLIGLWCGNAGRWCRAFKRWGSVRVPWVTEGTILSKYQCGSHGIPWQPWHSRESWLRRNKPILIWLFGFLFEKSFLLLYLPLPPWCLLQGLPQSQTTAGSLLMNLQNGELHKLLFFVKWPYLMCFIIGTNKQTSSWSLFLF